MSGVAKVLLSPVAALTGLLDKPKAPKMPTVPMAQPIATTRASSAVLDAVASRQGSLANRRTGTGGAEAGAGTKTSLGA